ncbi:MAG: tandem-95 repeat protein, partial [Opitutae bacterium]|nr:tandem-95 repeat protein [Opitutae bacterium]
MLGNASKYIGFSLVRTCARKSLTIAIGGAHSSVAQGFRLSILPFLVSIFLLGLGSHALGNVAPEISQGAGPLFVSMLEDDASSWNAPDLNATDFDAGDSLTWSVSGAATNGIATISGSGSTPSTFTYVPNLNFFGSDSFVAQVSDGALTDSVTVKVRVSPGPSPIFSTSVNGAGSVPAQTVLAAVGSMNSVTSTSAPVGTTPPFQLTATRGSMTDVSVKAGPVGTSPALQLEGISGSMGNLSVTTSVVASTPSFELTPLGGSMSSIQVVGPWSVFSYTGKGSGFFPSTTADISLIFLPNYPAIDGLFTSQTTTASVAGDGTLSFTIPAALQSGTHFISATPQWYQIPTASNMGSGYIPGFQPWVKVKRNGIELPTTGLNAVTATGTVGADGKVDITFTGNAVDDVNVTIEVESVYAFDTMNYSSKGSNYHVSENGGSLSKPVITISPPGGGSNQTVDATVAGNGTLSFTLPSTTTTGGVHTISASAGNYYQLPPVSDLGSGYTPGVHPATTITRNGNAVSSVSSSVTAGGDGKLDLTFSGNAGAGPLLVEVAPGSPAWVEGINSINVASAGTNYAVNDLITISAGGGTGAKAKVSAVGSGGEILSVSVVSQGSGYSSAPNATFAPPQKALHTQSLIPVASVSASRGQDSAGKTIDWSGMSGVQGDEAALQSDNRQHMWAPGNENSWIQWDFGSLKTVGRMLVWQFNEAGNPNRSIKKAKLEYSVDGAHWIDFSVSGDWPKSSGTAGNQTVLDVNSLNFSARYVRLTGIKSYHVDELQTGVSEVLFWVPKDASIINSSTSKSTNLAAKAFDDNTSTVWMPKQLALPNVYLQWQFTNPVQVNEYKIMVGDVSAEKRSPKDFTLQGSNDGSSWSSLATENNETGWGADEVRSYSVDSPALYTNYKLLISAAEGTDTYLGLREIELWSGSKGSSAVLSANLTTVNTSPFVDQGAGYHPSEHPTIRIPTPTGNDNNQTVTASVAANGKLTFTLPAPLEPKVYTISADLGTYYQLPAVFDRGSGYPSGHSPGVTFKRGGNAVAGMSGSATAATDGKVDSTFTGNAGSFSPVDVQILPGPLAFTPPSFSDQGSSKYDSSETPVVTITAPSSSTQTVNATVDANGTLDFTLPTPLETGVHDVNASFGSVVLLPSGLNGIGSGYLQSGAIPAVTITDPLGASRPGTVVTVNANGTLDLDFSSVSPTIAGDYPLNAEIIAYPPTPLSNVASGFNPDGFPPIVTFTGADKGTLSANASVNVDGTLNVTFSGAPSGYGNLSLSVTQAPGNLPKTDAEKIIAADSNASDQFGYSVSQSSDFIAVGASGENNNAGAVYLYKSETNGSISYLDKAIAPDRAFGDEFGLSVSQSGNNLSVGAWKADLPGKADTGATYLFRVEANGTVTYLQKVVAPDGAAGDGFGLSVSQSGNILSVGSYGADLPGKTDAGAVYLYRLESNGSITYLDKVIAPDGVTGDSFGQSLSHSGNILAVGAYKADLPGKADAGATYLYRVESNGTATYLTKLIAPDGGVGDTFGLSASQSGDILAIGACKADLPGKADAGATYLFRVEANGTATYLDKLLAPDGNAGDEFGLSVSQSGNILTVGASSVDVAATNVGAAYLFQLEANGMAIFLEKLTAPDAAAGNFFGHSVSQFGARLAVGSPFSNTSGKTDAGAAYVFRNRLWGNHKPVFSNASFAQFENNATSFFANATDLDPDDITAYSKSGPDAPLFTINVATGELYFTTPPDFENPVDSDGDNRYMVEITASDGISNTMQEFVVRVHNALEGSEKPPFVSVDLSGGTGASDYPVTYLNERPDDWNSSVYKTDKILLKWIAPGTFTMGQTGIETPFQVTQGVEFYIGVYETTGSQYAKVTGSDPSGKGGGMKPVENVNWDDLRGGVWPDGGPAGTSFLGKLRSKTSGAFFDLPTEAQWEYAARAGGSTTFSHGDGNATLGDYAWYLANSGGTTHEVGLKLPNPWGLYDLHGNVWEWCLDWSSAYAGGAVVDPVGSKSGTVRINRGGSYSGSSDWARLSHRGDSDPTTRFLSNGMRLVLNHSGRLTNRAPTDINATSTVVLEMESAGTLVGDFNASDPESNATHVFSLVQGSGSDQNNLFDIDANGTLTTKVVLDHETNATLSIRVRATDDYNASFDKVFAIEVLNINETPVITQGASLSVVLNEDEHPLSWSSQWANQVLGASDPDGDVLTWTLLTPPAHGTATVSGTGASPSIVVYSPNLDYSGSDSFVIKASDLNNSSDTVTLNVTLSPISDPPVFTGPVGSSFSVTVFENNTFVLDLNASDDLASGGRDNPGIPEASLNWSVSGADSSFFEIHSNSGELSFKNPPDYDFPLDADGNNVYELTATVDDGGLSASQDLNVTVTDLNEPPVISQGGSVSVVMDEDGDPLGWPLAWPSEDLNGTDPEGDVITWSLQTAPVHGTATVSGSGAKPTTFTYSPNPHYNGTDSFVAKLSDGLLSDSIIINVRINARPENGLIPLAKSLTYDLQIPDANNFLFTGGGYSEAPDPDLVLMEGVNYRFSPKIGDHPLFIGSSAGVPYAGNELTGNGAEGPDGILSFIPNENTPRQLVYYCAADGTMRGDIKIISARENKLVRPNPRPGDQFGISMSVLGNQVLVGSNGESRNGLSNTGSAHLFERDLNGEWLPVQAFRASSPDAGGRLGRDVSLWDNMVVAGAPGHDSVAGLKGAAYVFEKNSTSWSQTAKLSPSDGAIHDYFGQSVSARANRVLVGAHMADSGGVSAAGAAYIFEKSGNGTWLEKTKLVPGDSLANGHYGVSVSLDGDLALVGASGSNNANGVSTGAAYLIGRTESDTWVQITKLTPDDGVANDQFGQSVKLDGNFSYVGARLRDEGGVQDTGAVYVFQRLSNGQWVQQAKITPGNAGAEGYFGQSLDVRDNRLLVGAPGKIGDHAKSNPGYAYFFERDGNGNWIQKAKFVGYDGLSDDEMGFDVALGVSIFAGAPLRDDRGEDSGGAYVFDNSNWNDLPPVFSSEDDLTVTMDEDGEPLAWVSPNLTASDPNGDVLSWRAYYENPSESNGTVIVFGTGPSPETFQYRPKNDFNGTDTFILEVSDGLYVKKLKVVVTVNGQADEGVPVVRMMPGFQQSSLYANAKIGAPIAIWGSVQNGVPPFDYSLDFGDGQSVQGSVTDARFVGMDHQYQTSGLKTAVLTITDSIGQVVKANTQVRVFLPSMVTVNETRNMAIERGLLYLYLNAVEDVQTNGLKWLDTKQETVYTTATTGFVSMAFSGFGHSALTVSTVHAYGDVVRKALRYLTENEAVGMKDIPDHSDDGLAVRQSDDPTGKVPGKGVYLVETGGHDAYSNAIALLALLNSFPDSVKASDTLVAGGPFVGWTYKELAEEAMQLLFWTQGDDDTRGGWEYRLTQDQPQYDGSVQQWPVLALKTAQEKWGLDVPTWVKDNVDHAYATITNANGAVGYRSNSHWWNVTKTGGRLVSDAWMGRSSADPLAAPSITFISDRWMTADGWTRGLYAAYGVKKGLSATGLKMIQTPEGSRDWDMDMASWLLGIEANLAPSMNPQQREKEKGFGQYDDGHWQGYRSSTFSTALALGILSRGSTDFPPMPEASFPQAVSANKPFFIDGAKSFHSDSLRSIADWKWKWNWSGSASSIDWSSPDAVGLRPTHPGFASVGQGEFAMRITDDGDPAKSSVKVFSILVSSGNHPAIPEPIPFSRLPVYSSKVNQKLVVDGGSSFDLDLYDSVTGYSWDINGTGVFQEGSRFIELGPYGHAFQGQVGLRVRDEDFTTWSDPKYVDLYVAEQDLNIVVMQVDPFNLQ